MLYKIHNSPIGGDWKHSETGERLSILELNDSKDTYPEGWEEFINDWTEFASIEEAAQAWSLIKWQEPENNKAE